MLLIAFLAGCIFIIAFLIFTEHRTYMADPEQPGELHYERTLPDDVPAPPVHAEEPAKRPKEG